MRGANPVVGRPIALQSRWNRGDLSLPTFYGPGVDAFTLGSNSLPPAFTCQTSATPHAKGAWTQFVAATTVEIDGLVIHPQSLVGSGTDVSCLLDIGIGAAASEVAIVTEIESGFVNPNSILHAEMVIPVRIPLGSRVAFRVQGVQTAANRSFYTSAIMVPTNGRRSPTSLVTMGASTSTSAGTTLTQSGTNNVKSAWTQITAATTLDFRGMICCIGVAAGTTAATNGQCLVDFAVGAAGAEVVVCANRAVGENTNETLAGQRWTLIERHIPAGSRIAARYQSDDKTTPISASVIGVPY